VEEKGSDPEKDPPTSPEAAALFSGGLEVMGGGREGRLAGSHRHRPPLLGHGGRGGKEGGRGSSSKAAAVALLSSSTRKNPRRCRGTGHMDQFI